MMRRALRVSLNQCTKRAPERFQPLSTWSKFKAWAYDGSEVLEKDSGPLPMMTESNQKHVRALGQQYTEGGKCPGITCGKPVEYSCPKSGFPTHCSQKCYDEDEAHTDYVEALTTIHKDLNDLYSGRPFPEFQYPGAPRPGPIELVNWTMFFMDRHFQWNTQMRSARHISQMFTWPLSIAYALQKASGASQITDLANPDSLGGDWMQKDKKIRVCILGARQEATLPDRVWQELAFLCPGVAFTLHFVGPEVPEALNGTENTLKKGTANIQENEVSNHEDLIMKFDRMLFEELPADTPAPDLFVLFNSGVGFQNASGSDTWDVVMQVALDSKKPILFTAFSAEDVKRDQAYLETVLTEDNSETLIGFKTFEENPFMNMKKDAARNNYRYMINSNHSFKLVRGI